jgi:hypothetical protein
MRQSKVRVKEVVGFLSLLLASFGWSVACSTGSTPVATSDDGGGGGSSGGGASSSGGTGSSGGSSGSSSGGTSSSGSSSGSMIPVTGVCANTGTRVLMNDQSDAFIDDFEEATISPGWSSFNDVSPVENSYLITQVLGGAAGTAHAGHYAGMGAKTAMQGGFGVGTVYNTAIDPSAGIYCVDIAAFTGVSFWAKAGNATNTTVSLNFVLPQTNMATSNDAGIATGGDCETNCYNHPRVTFTLTTSWAQYTAPFAMAAGGTAKVGSVIQELAWLSPDSTWDFTLDEIAFYNGTPPAGAVGPNPNMPQSDDAGTQPSGDAGGTASDAGTD